MCFGLVRREARASHVGAIRVVAGGGHLATPETSQRVGSLCPGWGRGFARHGGEGER